MDAKYKKFTLLSFKQSNNFTKIIQGNSYAIFTLLIIQKKYSDLQYTVKTTFILSDIYPNIPVYIRLDMHTIQNKLLAHTARYVHRQLSHMYPLFYNTNFIIHTTTYV